MHTDTYCTAVFVIRMPERLFDVWFLIITLPRGEVLFYLSCVCNFVCRQDYRRGCSCRHVTSTIDWNGSMIMPNGLLSTGGLYRLVQSKKQRNSIE